MTTIHVVSFRHPEWLDFLVTGEAMETATSTQIKEAAIERFTSYMSGRNMPNPQDWIVRIIKRPEINVFMPYGV